MLVSKFFDSTGGKKTVYGSPNEPASPEIAPQTRSWSVVVDLKETYFSFKTFHAFQNESKSVSGAIVTVVFLLKSEVTLFISGEWFFPTNTPTLKEKAITIIAKTIGIANLLR